MSSGPFRTYIVVGVKVDASSFDVSCLDMWDAVIDEDISGWTNITICDLVGDL